MATETGVIFLLEPDAIQEPTGTGSFAKAQRVEAEGITEV
jgi:hypothetical protein